MNSGVTYLRDERIQELPILRDKQIQGLPAKCILRDD